MMYPLVREVAVDGIPVTVTCRVLKITRAPYSRWHARSVTTAELVEAYRAMPCSTRTATTRSIGYRFLLDETRAAGEPMTARAICSANQWWSVFGKKRAKNGKRPGPPVHVDKVKRDFSATAVNRSRSTVDAMHTQTETAMQITAVGGDYVFTVKGNQPKLYHACKALPWKDVPAYTTKARGHGRRTARTIKVVTTQRGSGSPARPRSHNCGAPSPVTGRKASRSFT